MRIRAQLSLAIIFAAFTPAAAVGKPAAPAPPKAVSASLSGTALWVAWSPTARGRVEVRVRVARAGRKATSTTRAAAANRGRLKLKVTGAAGTAPAAAAVAVRARRCTGSGRARRCGRWSTTVRPTLPTTPGTATPPPVSATVPVLPPGSGPTVGSCPLMPADYALNQDVSTLPLDPRSADYVASIGLSARVHPDFGAADLGQGPGGFGIPYRVVPASQPLVQTVFGDYADESDPGPYPVPLDSPIEGGPNSGGDRHVIVVREGECKLYEMGNAYPGDGRWEASGGAVWNLNTGLRPPAAQPGWTSADAAGLPILPGLVRYDEVAAGEIRHAVRFTVARSQRAYIAPASHWASSITDPSVPPMGLRLRMRADYDLSRFRGQSLVIATALKRYGMIVADNGSNWYITGAADPRWDDEDLNQLKTIPGSAFEAVQTGSVVRP